MKNRIVELSENPTRLRVRNKLIELRDDNELLTSIPVSDVAVLIASHPRVTMTQSVLGELSAAGGVFVTCDKRRQPIGMMLPLDGFHQQVRRFRAQAAATLPTQKRAWQRIIRAKIRGQANTLISIRGNDAGLAELAATVKSGDPSNVEAQAARRYWNRLFGNQFRRDRDACDENMWLNYGYSVLRAIVARAICASGLHPGLGLHHQHRSSGFPLADDLMEPFRPIVDRIVFEVTTSRRDEYLDDKTIRRKIIACLSDRYSFEHESRTLFDLASRLASSLAGRYEGTLGRVEVPTF